MPSSLVLWKKQPCRWPFWAPAAFWGVASTAGELAAENASLREKIKLITEQRDALAKAMRIVKDAEERVD